MRAWLLAVPLLLGLASASPYVGANITRTYYEDELESCPGKLDMQPGDLWTLSFPDGITDSFLTRDGLVERKVQGNRVVMAVTATAGSSPMIVLTEDGHAPRFELTVSGGMGGRNKNVVIKPGLPPTGTTCAGLVQSPAAPAAVKPAGVTVPVVSSVAAPRPRLVLKPRAPSPAVPTPAARRIVKPPQVVKPLQQAAAAVSPPIPTVPTPQPAPVVAVPRTSASPVIQALRLPVVARGPGYLTVTVRALGSSVLSVHLSNTLDADVMLDERNLTFGDTTSRHPRTVVVSAGESVTLIVLLTRPGPAVSTQLRWTGAVLGSGETFTLSATVPIPG